MSFSVGIVGLPNAGKSTLFKALTRQPVEIAPHSFTTITPNIGVVEVPDEKLEKIARVIKPEKVTPTTIKFFDIAGLVQKAHQGEGLGNQFLAHIRNCNAVLEVVRAFEDPNVEHVINGVDPKRDMEIVEVELLMKDLETLEGLLEKLAKDVKTQDKKAVKKFEFLKRIKEAVSEGKLISELNLITEEKAEIREYQLLTLKPSLCLLNLNKDYKEKFSDQLSALLENLPPDTFLANLKFEEDLIEFSEEEARQLRASSASPLEVVIKNCYNTLDLITFYTVAGLKETRAWTIKKGATASQAAGHVHSDFEKKFIKAGIIPWKKLVEIGSWSKAKELGEIKIVGRDHLVQDGDIIEFKI